jgi:chaperone modulatory protein CbpM
MEKQGLLIIADYSAQQPVTLAELCDICHISSDFIQELIAFDVVHPKGHAPNEWIFELAELQRIQKALRLQRDLEVNLAGVALALNLLEELEELRAEVNLLHRHY